MSTITEVAPDIYRVCTYWPEINLQFALFVVKDDEPVLFHTLMRGWFPQMREAVSKIIDPAKLRWISFSHFEADECGALNDWLSIAPQAQAVTAPLGVLVNLSDFAIRPARALGRDEVLATGKHRFHYIPTPHLPHGWDAGVMFDETTKTLLCSDLFHQNGECEPLTQKDVIGSIRQTLTEYQGNELLANYMPYTPQTGRILEGLAKLQPETLATMHGSVYHGNGAQALRDLDTVMSEVLGWDAAERASAG